MAIRSCGKEYESEIDFQIAFTKFSTISFKSDNLQTVDLQTVYNSFYLCAGMVNGYDKSYGIIHHVYVYRNAVRILEGFEDLHHLFEIVACASLLYGVVTDRHPDRIDANNKRLNNFLQINSLQINSPQQNAFGKNVRWIIDNLNMISCHPDPSVNTAKNIVFDAITLETIGKRGLIRLRDSIIIKYPNSTHDEVFQMFIKQCKEERKSLPLFIIDKAREIGIKYHTYMLNFIDNSNEKCLFLLDDVEDSIKFY